MTDRKESFFVKNEYYDPRENSTHELFNLLLHLPDDFRTKKMNEDQLKRVSAALIYSCSVKQTIIEGMDAVGNLLAQLPTDIQEGGESTCHLSRGTVQRLGGLLQHMAAMIFVLWQLEISLSDVLERHE